jgi:predicted dehydrogenase
MVKTAIVGCGKIADAHATQLQQLANCEIVGVCDREPLMARQLAERFPVKACYSDLETMLRESRPDAVHITTPPATHFALAKTCLEAGCHVYVEKPFTLYAREAEELIHLANERGLKMTAGHDDQFSNVTRRMRTLVQSGYLGRLTHMESYFCYELGDNAYVAALLSDKNHWVSQLPGRLLHNIISHGVARVAEFLPGDAPLVTAYGFTSPFLKERGATELIDELRVIIADPSGVTAYFTFSSQMRPSLHSFRLYGDKNGLLLNQDQETLIKLRGKLYPSYAEKFLPPLTMARQYLGNLGINMKSFLGRDFHLRAGMRRLMEAFYRSIAEDTPPPIPYREILLTARIMDAIFVQLDPSLAAKQQ